MKTLFDQFKKTAFFLFFVTYIIYGQDSLFPKVPGWTVTVEDEVYDANNLWDIIDGAADLFLEYYFVDLHTARYINVDSVEVKVELYRHNTPINAFGMYSQERDPGYHFIQVGVQGYIEEGVLNFLDGIYYIKISTYEKGKTGQNAMITVAQKMDDFLKQENSFPKIMQCFPEKSKKPNTEKYIAQNFLGYSYLNSVISVSYNDDITFTAFVIMTKTLEDANSTVKKFLDAQKKENIFHVGDNRYEVTDQNNGRLVFDVQKHFIFGLINCTDESKKEKFMNDFNTKLEAL